MAKNGKFKTICLCGSTRFKEEFIKARNRLTKAGYVVLGPEVFTHADGENTTDFEKAMLDDMHLQKIAMSDEIFVVNVRNYIGYSTIREIQYASSLHIPIRYLERNYGETI